ncbi:immunoglobulin-like domain-containing protein, partial [Paenibacillus xanthanilyticus]
MVSKKASINSLKNMLKAAPKTVISSALIASIVASAFSGVAGATPLPNMTVEVTTDKATYAPGDEVIVSVKLKDIGNVDPSGLWSESVAVLYDASVFDSTPYTQTSSGVQEFTAGNFTKGNLVADETKYDFYTPTVVTSANDPDVPSGMNEVRLVVMDQSVGSNPIPATDQVIATFKLRVKADAPDGTVEFDFRDAYTQMVLNNNGDPDPNLYVDSNRVTEVHATPQVQLPPSDSDLVAAARGALAIGYTGSDSAASVTGNLTLPTLAGTSNDVTVSWTSSDPAFVANNGTVTRPTFAQGNQSVTLTATLSKNGVSDTKPFVLTLPALNQTDAEAVAADKAALSVGYAAGDSATSVTQSITLPPAGTNGTTITWTSDKAAVVAADGTVTRPSFAQGNQSVKLTATIERNGVSETREFPILVLASAMTDAEAVAADKAVLAVGYVAGDSATGVTQGITLPPAGTNGTTITWTSDNTAVVAADGTVTRPTFAQGNQSVKLTATIERNGVSETREFPILVLASAMTDAEAVAADKAALAVGYAAGDSATSVTQGITLPPAGTNGTIITWASDN